MMWRTQRKPKVSRKNNKPRVALQFVFCLAGVLSVGFVVFSIFSLTRPPMLVVPVSLARNMRGVDGVFQSSPNELIEKELKDKNIPYLFVTSSADSAYVVTMEDNAEVIMKKDDIESQIASLQLITHRLTMEGKRFTRLDLRFDRPVIVLK